MLSSCHGALNMLLLDPLAGHHVCSSCIMLSLIMSVLLVQMTGTIPAELGSLKKLEALKLENNAFQGSLPASLR